MSNIKNVLITGGAGFVGSSLAQKLVEDGKYKVTVVDNLLTGTRKNIFSESDKYKFVKANANNLADMTPIMTSQRFDYIFHYAAVVGVQRTLDNPTMVLDDIDGLKNILSLAKNTGVERVFFSSSSEVYGEPFEIPQNEDTTPLNARLPYAIVKSLGEAFLKSYHQEFGLNYTAFRFFNTYGPRQSSDFVMSIFIKKALAGEDIPVIGDGSQTRTFCYVDDNIEVTKKILEGGEFINDVVNIGNSEEITILELAETVIRLTKSKSKIIHLAARVEGDMKRRKPDNKKMMRVLNREMTPLEDGIKNIIKYWA